VETWRNELVNDFEIPVLREYPQIAEVKKLLYANGALYASLTGSGSAVYGIFSKNKVPELKWDKTHTQKKIPEKQADSPVMNYRHLYTGICTL
jgi:4-diphosphocytidyl-2-C-methyl-D-erythritol kinase